MRYLPNAVEIGLLVVLLLLAWWQIESDRNNPPEPFVQQDAGQLVQQAEAAYAQGDVAQASRLYWHAIKRDRTQVEARVRLAAIYQSSIHAWESDALKLVRDALDLDPHQVEAHLLLGKITRNQGLPEDAAREYLEVIRLDPTNTEAHYQLGTLYEGARQFEDAVYHYTQAIAGDPELKQPPLANQPFGILARLQYGRLKSRQGDTEGAIRLLEEALSLAPNFSDAQLELVQLLYRRAGTLIREGADPSTQLANYRRILKAEPEDPESWLRIGEIYEYSFNQLTKAMAAYQKAYELDPSYTQALLNIRSLEIEMQGHAPIEE